MTELTRRNFNKSLIGCAAGLAAPMSLVSEVKAEKKHSGVINGIYSNRIRFPYRMMCMLVPYNTPTFVEFMNVTKEEYVDYGCRVIDCCPKYLYDISFFGNGGLENCVLFTSDYKLDTSRFVFHYKNLVDGMYHFKSIKDFPKYIQYIQEYDW